MEIVIFVIYIMTNGIQYINSQDSKWKIKSNGRIYSYPTFSSENIFFESGNRYIFSINKKSGVINCKFNTGGAVHNSPTIKNGIANFSIGDRKLYAKEKNEGKLKFVF